MCLAGGGSRRVYRAEAAVVPGVVWLEPAFIPAEIASPRNQLAGPDFTGNLAYSFAGIDS